MTPNQLQQTLDTFPLLPGWLAEIGRKPEDIQYVGIFNDPIRDHEEEARVGTHWKIYKPGDFFEITLVLSDESRHTKTLTVQEWGALFKKPEDKPE